MQYAVSMKVYRRPQPFELDAKQGCKANSAILLPKTGTHQVAEALVGQRSIFRKTRL